MSVAIWLTLAGCFCASYYDVRARRIPNVLTGSLALAALVVHSFSGVQAALVSLAVMAVLTVAATLVYSRGGIGGGDLKLAIAASGMVSFPLCIPFILYTAIGGGLLAILYLIFRPASRPSLANVALMAAGVSNIAVRRTTLPYALAFAFGAVVLALSHSVAPFLRI